jgi:hypothetical protein
MWEAVDERAGSKQSVGLDNKPSNIFTCSVPSIHSVMSQQDPGQEPIIAYPLNETDSLIITHIPAYCFIRPSTPVSSPRLSFLPYQTLDSPCDKERRHEGQDQSLGTLG